METNENNMTNGEIKFYIDDVECPDTNGVGVGAIGGVFNCGLTGSAFKAVCTTTCSPFMNIVEIKLWKDTVMTLDDTKVYFPGGEAGCAGYNY